MCYNVNLCRCYYIYGIGNWGMGQEEKDEKENQKMAIAIDKNRLWSQYIARENLDKIRGILGKKSKYRNNVNWENVDVDF